MKNMRQRMNQRSASDSPYVDASTGRISAFLASEFCSQARQVCIYCYSGHSAALWWERLGSRLAHLHNLTVINLPSRNSQALAGLAQRNMQLQCTIQDGQLWIGDADSMVEVNPEIWQQSVSKSH